MSPTLAVSSYSLREHLGPLEFRHIDETGTVHEFSFPFPLLTSLAEFPANARERFGVDAVETVALQFAGVDDPQIDAFGAALRDSGTTLLNVAIDAGELLDPNPERRAADILELTAWIGRFAALGTRFVRVNPGSPFAAHRGERPPQYLVDDLRELGGFARDHGVRLLVENHGGPSSDPRWMLALLDEVGSERLGLLLDLGNFDALLEAVSGLVYRDPGAPAPDAAAVLDAVDLTSVYQGIEALAPRTELVHVKIHDVDDHGNARAIDLDRALGILRGHGYDGPLTIEYEGSGGDPWAKTARVVDLTRRAVEEAA